MVRGSLSVQGDVATWPLWQWHLETLPAHSTALQAGAALSPGLALPFNSCGLWAVGLTPLSRLVYLEAENDLSAHLLE